VDVEQSEAWWSRQGSAFVCFFSLARQVAAAYDFIPRQSKERALNKPPSACIRRTPSLSGTLLSLGNACVLEVPRPLCPPLCNAALPLVPVSLRPRAVAVEDSRKTARDQITKPQPAGKPTSARGTMTTEHHRCVKARRCEVME
jgi:hypothetical protein